MLKTNQIHHGDCLKLMHEIPDGSIDMVLADLPYGTIDAAWDSIIPFEPLWKHYKRIIKPNGSIVLFGQDPFSAMLVVSNIDWYRHKWIWIKDKAANFLAAAYAPLKYTEDVLVFSPAGFTHNSNPKAIYNPQMIPGEWRPPRKNRVLGKSISQIKKRPITSHKAILNPKSHHSGTKRYPENYIYYPTPYYDKRVHTTQKPAPLCAYFIRTYTNPGDIVLDNVAGIGTTAIAAIETGRNWLCIENSPDYTQPIGPDNPDYYGLAKERIKERLKQPFLPGLVTGQPNKQNAGELLQHGLWDEQG